MKVEERERALLFLTLLSIVESLICEKDTIMLDKAQITLMSHEKSRDLVDSALMVEVQNSKLTSVESKSDKFRFKGAQCF